MSKLVEAVTSIKEIEAPEWAAFVKTAVHKERPPMQPEWWQIRAASVLNKVNKYGPIGTNGLSKKYSGRKNRGVRPDRKADGSRNITRKILQQLEKAGLIKQVTEPKSGKVVTKEGMALINNNR